MRCDLWRFLWIVDIILCYSATKAFKCTNGKVDSVGGNTERPLTWKKIEWKVDRRSKRTFLWQWMQIEVSRKEGERERERERERESTLRHLMKTKIQLPYSVSHCILSFWAQLLFALFLLPHSFSLLPVVVQGSFDQLERQKREKEKSTKRT